ncbi:PEP-CTERM sorting domain-containing protein [Marinobacter fonticola]|uniref:PEP-CTERM sorting domain-containing protein n=1 Tax=Marinobacter fonticola TaxID=2603215 RepID=UPI0011E6635E|nr:PEP-CTERM sorting domain-containing protein [Marinobacter fonticola]
MRKWILALIVCLPVFGQASPIWNYEIQGVIDNKSTDVEASSRLKDIESGHLFAMKMSAQLNGDGELDIVIAGTIGAWGFYPERALGYYYLGDYSPERLGVNLNGAGSPQGTSGAVSLSDVQMILFGFDTYTDTNTPYAEWLLKDDGFIDPQWFLHGSLSLFFAAEHPSGEWREHNLDGTITSFRRVPEPSALALLALGIAAIGYRCHRR